MRRQYHEKRPNIPADIKRDIKVKAGHACTIKNCMEQTYLEIHHINQNREDNRIENLILLCDKHHKMAHENKIDRKALNKYKDLLNIQIQHHETMISNNSDFYNNLINEFERKVLEIGFDWLETLPEVDWSLEVKTYDKLYSLTKWIRSRDWIDNNDLKTSFENLSLSIEETLEFFERHCKHMDDGNKQYYIIDKFYKQVDCYTDFELREKLNKDFDEHIKHLIHLTIEVANNFNIVFRLIRKNINNIFLSNEIIPILHGIKLV